MKGGITTNLLGRRVRITIGLTDEELTREIESMRRQKASVWRGDARAHLGEFGEVTAVYKDGDHCLQFTLALEGGNFATVTAGHCRLLADERAAMVPAGLQKCPACSGGGVVHGGMPCDVCEGAGVRDVPNKSGDRVDEKIATALETLGARSLAGENDSQFLITNSSCMEAAEIVRRGGRQ